MGPATLFVNEIYGTTGNYRTLAEELTLADEAGFEVEMVTQIPNEQYQKTMTRWLANMERHRAELQDLDGPAYFRRLAPHVSQDRSTVHRWRPDDDTRRNRVRESRPERSAIRSNG